jgi:hypothetical protein
MTRSATAADLHRSVKTAHSHCPVRDTTPSPVIARIGIKSERKGKKNWGKKMETSPRIQRADQNSPLSNATSPVHQIVPVKKIIFLPQIFLPTRPPLERDDPSSQFSTASPHGSVPICESEANLCSNHSRHHPSSHAAASSHDKGIGFSCPHSPAVPPPRGNDRAGIG